VRTDPSAGAAVSNNSKRDVLQATGRAGLVARGIVYGVIGILALKLALGSGGKTENQTGARRSRVKRLATSS
jgi:hypothetical protein